MEVHYTLIRSRRKTIALQLTPALEVVVRAPLRMPKREIDAFVSAHRQWIAEHTAALRERMAANPPATPAEIEALRQAAKAYIPPRVALFAAEMGLVPSAVKINAAKTRFGSCSGKNSLNFSCLLMKYPPEAVDYVIVHELAHIVHKNHGKDFYALIARHMPDFRARRALLKG